MIRAGDGNDTVYGCGGDDTIYGGGAGDRLFGGPGNDRLFGQLLDDKLYGEQGRDLLVGSHGSDEMRGGPGSDWLRGGTGGDDYHGGPDDVDVASFIGARPGAGAGSQAGVRVNVTNSANPEFGVPARSASGEGEDTVQGIEAVLGSAFDDVLIGNGTADSAASGAPGDDRCRSFVTRDSCDGAAGPTRPFVSLETWHPEGVATPDPALVVIGGPLATAAQSLQASPSDPTVSVSARRNLRGLGEFRVAPMFTSFSTAPPCTTTTDGSGTVVCPILRAVGGIAVIWGGDGPQNLNVLGPPENNAFPSGMTIEVDGGSGDDNLNGGASDENLYGADGADLVHGHGGDDALISEGTGPDQLFGDNGDDQLVTNSPCQGHIFHGGPGRDIAGFARTIMSGVTATLGGRAFLGQEAACANPTTLVDTGASDGDVLEILEGTRVADLLIGNARNNTIWGRAGDDELRGLDGADVLIGHAGADEFLGGAGFDLLFARDGRPDERLACGQDGGRLETHDPGEDPVQGSGCTLPN